jgi:hypothetical protein
MNARLNPRKAMIGRPEAIRAAALIAVQPAP